MEPQFQSSFIPKKPVTSESHSFVAHSTMSVGIFSIVGNALVVLTLVACISLFSYTLVLKNKIADLHKQIVSAKEVFQPDTIQALIKTSNKLTSAQQLLQKHTAPTEIFDALQSLVFKKARFTNFTYTNKNNNASITMQIEASSYNVLEQQSLMLSGAIFIGSPIFSDFKVLDTGNISTKFNANIDPSLLLYSKIAGTLNSNGINTTNQATTTTP